jgi:hypothetical protein
MTASALETTVGNVLDRIVAMERLAVPDAVNAVKHWWHWEQKVPYWTNGIEALTNPVQGEYELKAAMRLIVGHISQATAGGTLSIQDKSWGYIPAVLAYFTKYNQLNAPALSDLANLAPDGVLIACPGGLDVFNIPGQVSTFLYVDFTLTVPLLIYEE